MARFSANLGFLWPDRPLLDRIDAAAAAGFRAIELHWPYDFPPQYVRARCEALGLTLLGINTSPGDTGKGEFGRAALAGCRQAFEADFEQALDWARLAGASAIHVMAGVVEPARKDEAQAVLVENLKQAAARAPDMTLLLEGINQRDKPGYFYSTIAKKADIIRQIGASNVKIMFDAYHVGIAEGDIFARLKTHLPLIAHVQIAAVPSRAEPDEGEIHYGNLIGELDRLGYHGWIGCEYKPRAGTDEGLHWVQDLGARLY
ncbi:hydroxypyruvate isomerase family protein [Martelella mediterranea]|uniref:Putative hydroxypyruvate isomerase YgbM n=1 Tax=Martelella mediterranea DSM 17316 TaxID=1122214 RepID=A0A1U9YWQ9_9HYPH|nr:TIM barrel protein [Martelella mediterranea]AQZ49864.1 Putative hydroxypyruvate isomerase YgbM [Martelella mediterranea DSM 17316]